MDFKISYDSEELISECREDIEEFGRDYPAFAVFQTYKSHSLLVNYLIGSEPPTVAELEGEGTACRSTLGEILKVLEKQNQIF